MTREDAIKVLRTESVEIGGNAVSVARWLTALDAVVKALEEVPDKDVGKNEPLTNAQKIRAMSDEELVNLHYSGSAHCIASDPTVCDRHDFIGNLTPCEQCYLKWLQQPAEEDDHE